MSDGNFNRSMLPSNSYQSGVRAGRAQMMHLAVAAFTEMLKMQHPNLSEEALSVFVADFKSKLK